MLISMLTYEERDLRCLKNFYPKTKEKLSNLGSTNRLADAHIIAEIRRLKEHTSFDQLRIVNIPLLNLILN